MYVFIVVHDREDGCVDGRKQVCLCLLREEDFPSENVLANHLLLNVQSE